MSDSKGSSALEVAVSFILGAAAGYLFGVLMAPASGKETREKIKTQASKTGEKAKDSYEKITKEAEKGIQVVREKAQEGIESIKDFIEKKKEELTQKPSPGHQKD